MKPSPTFPTPWRTRRLLAFGMLAAALATTGVAHAGDSDPAAPAAEAPGKPASELLARITVAGRDPQAIERGVAAVAALRARPGGDERAPIYLDAADEQAAAALVDRLWAAGLAGTYLVRAHPQPDGETAAALKRQYLACEEQATLRRLDFGDAARCSQLYEVLLRGVFRGRYEDLHGWWKGAVAMP